MKHSLRGFTLIELMVSIALFSIVMTIVSGAYLNLLALDLATRANNDLNTNLNFVLDTMTRDIREGGNYKCGGSTNCPTNPASSFSFTDSANLTESYSLVNGAINHCSANGVCEAITDPRVVISNLGFYVSGSGAGDGVQPTVTIVMHGTVRSDPRNTTAFSLETSVVQRAIDL